MLRETSRPSRGERENTLDVTGRLGAFSDAVFAVALTLLALDMTRSVEAADWTALQRQLFGVIASFVIVGQYWIAHHNEVRLLAYIDRWFMWLNLVFLFFVVLVPVSTFFLVRYSGDSSLTLQPLWAYVLNMVLLGLGIEALWAYASKSHGGSYMDWLKPHKSYELRETHIRNWIPPVGYFLVGLISLIPAAAIWAQWLLFAPPVAYIIREWLWPRGTFERPAH
jgi:uncharacterized membrane protein